MNKKDYIKFTGEQIRVFRKAKKLTQKQLAELCGVSHGFISRIENGTCSMSTENLQTIARVLNANIDDLLPDARIDYIIPSDNAKRQILIEYIKFMPDAELDKLIQFVELYVNDKNKRG